MADSFGGSMLESSKRRNIQALVKCKNMLELNPAGMGIIHISDAIQALKLTEPYKAETAATRSIVANMLLTMLISRRYQMTITDALYLKETADRGLC